MAEYTQGIMAGGAAILKDGEAMFTKDVVEALNKYARIQIELINLRRPPGFPALDMESTKSDGPLTPPRGEPMPQTQEYWEKRAAMDQELILEQRDEINRLKCKVNKLEQKAKQ